ncbi:hypothetical protein E2C01_098429 [Portunus trituberculatus]|uniref:Uncharacterized protein n=1 Tax=Portunus trituberculatus TaxID=210409 RepID=A0A5B7K885_PORTR|nr:hypothetical protein [Portunus trituberculatus]
MPTFAHSPGSHTWPCSWYTWGDASIGVQIIKFATVRRSHSTPGWPTSPSNAICWEKFVSQGTRTRREPE